MKKPYRHFSVCAAAMLLLVTAGFLLAGCGAGAEWKYDPITDVNDLEGRRVGVNLSWESDYYLTGRPDMELFRYDTTSDMIMALKYDKIDAIAVDEDGAKLITSLSDGIEVVKPAFAQVGSVMYFGSNDADLVEDFNQYLREYKKTDGYRDMLKRLKAFDGTEYIGTEIPLTGTGETLRVIADPNNFPRAFLNPGEDIISGYDVEILKHYANDRNYRLDFSYSDYNDGIMGLRTGSYDIMTGYLSDVYNEEVKLAGFYVCDNLFDFPMYFMQKNKRDITSDTGALE